MTESEPLNNAYKEIFQLCRIAPASKPWGVFPRGPKQGQPLGPSQCWLSGTYVKSLPASLFGVPQVEGAPGDQVSWG